MQAAFLVWRNRQHYAPFGLRNGYANLEVVSSLPTLILELFSLPKPKPAYKMYYWLRNGYANSYAQIGIYLIALVPASKSNTLISCFS